MSHRMKFHILLRLLVGLALSMEMTPVQAAEKDPSKTATAESDSPKLLQQDAPIDQLISALESNDFNTKMRAVSFIGRRGNDSKQAVPALIKAMSDRPLRESSLHALREIGPDAADAVPALFKMLSVYPNEPATRWLAAQALASIGQASIPTLEKGVSSTNLYEKLWSHAALGMIEGPTSNHIRILAESMNSEDPTTSLESVSGLTMIGPAAKVAIPRIIDAFQIPTAPKTDLAMLLAQMGKDAAPAIPQLITLLDDPTAITRQRAAYALSRVGGAELAPAIPGLIELFQAKEAYVREMAATALGSSGNTAEEAIPAVIERLQDDDEHVRSAAAQALGEISPKDARVHTALVKAMNDESGRVRSQAAPILARHVPVNKETIDLFVKASSDNWGSVKNACESFFTRLEPKDRDLIPAHFREGRRH